MLPYVSGPLDQAHGDAASRQGLAFLLAEANKTWSGKPFSGGLRLCPEDFANLDWPPLHPSAHGWPKSQAMSPPSLLISWVVP